MFPNRRASGNPSSDDIPASGSNKGAIKSLIRVCFETGGNPTEQLLAFLTTYMSARYTTALAQRIAVTAYELLDNGLAYCSVANEVIFEIVERDHFVELSVSNHAVPARVARLREQIARLRTDAAATYTEAMQRSVVGGLTRSMLGLARVTYEARMDLHLEEAGGGRVLVVARCAR
jgi:hypothetical protein